MSEECAFCADTANRSGEHFWSDWMSPLFPGEKRFINTNTEMKAAKEWSEPVLNVKAKVVCKACNEGWMSNIESQHAKPAMMELIAGKVDIPIPQARARSIALFAFKTAVICDHTRRSYPIRFFPRQLRHRFREMLEIPHNVQMWFAGFLPRADGACLTIYHNLPGPDGLDLYVCTYCVGHFVFQVVADRKPISSHLSPADKRFENIAVPFWPRIADGFVWPPKAVLMTARDFQDFANRWGRIHAFKLTGA
jgi:hypothetical protein